MLLESFGMVGAIVGTIPTPGAHFVLLHPVCDDPGDKQSTASVRVVAFCRISPLQLPRQSVFEVIDCE